MDNAVSDYIKDMNVSSLGDVHTLYSNIMELKRFLERKLISTHDRQTYYAYKEIYQTLLTTELIPQVFATEEDEETGEYTLAKSFEDLLYHRNSYLYSKLIDPDVEVDKEIDNVLMTLKSLSDRLEYLEMAEGIDIEILVTHLYNLLEFARSAKTELREFEIIYLLNSRATNIIKLFMELEEMHAEIYLEDVGMRFEDVINSSEYSYQLKEEMVMQELLIHFMKVIAKDDKCDLKEKMKDIYAVVQVFELMNLNDSVQTALYELHVHDRMDFVERFINQSSITDVNDILDLTHQVLVYNRSVDEKDILPLEDILIPSILEIQFRTNMILTEELIPNRILYQFHEGVEMIENMVSSANRRVYEMLDMIDMGGFDISRNLDEFYRFTHKFESQMAVCFHTMIKPYIRCMKNAEYYYNETIAFVENLVEDDFGEVAEDQLSTAAV